MKHLWNRSKGRRGQAVLEMAIFMPLLVTLTLGVIEFGFMLNSYITVVNLAREGARAVLDGATNCEVRDTIAFEGNRRLQYTNRGVTHIVRGVSDNSGNIPAATWFPQTDPTTGKPTVALLASRTALQNANLNSLNGSTGVNFVVVEVHYVYPAITKLPGVDGFAISSRTFMRSNQPQSAASNGC